ncbi:MAG: hypothetical protein ABIQ33_13645 [Caldimonas sp.]
MNVSSPSSDTGRARRLIVTLLVGSAAAAVSAGVVLNERRPGEAVAQRAEANPAVAGTALVPADARRVQWRDPWKRPGPLSESTPTSTGGAADAGAAVSDPSLPPAAEALKGGALDSGAHGPTF